MKEVTVKKDQLLETLRTNRTEHQEVFEEALEGYKATVVAKLEQFLADAKAGKRVAETFHLPLPVNQTAEYNRAIKMLEMSVAEEITLTRQEFDQYVMDRWSWKRDFLLSNSTYSLKAATLMPDMGEYD